MDAANRKVSSEINERSGGEIQVELGTAGASINNLYSDSISVDYKVILESDSYKHQTTYSRTACGNELLADGVVVRV